MRCPSPTVTCACWHVKKFDPIPTKDYYSLRGIFVSSAEPSIEPVISKIEGGAEYSDYYKKRMALESEKTVLEAKFLEARRARNREALQTLQRAFRENQG